MKNSNSNIGDITRDLPACSHCATECFHVNTFSYLHCLFLGILSFRTMIFFRNIRMSKQRNRKTDAHGMDGDVLCVLSYKTETNLT